jgi:hypothetical protein
MTRRPALLYDGRPFNNPEAQTMPDDRNLHDHTTPHNLTSAMPSQHFAAVIGTVEKATEHEIVGRSGEHLQFYVDAGADARYQVDVNIQSRDGTEVLVYMATESLAGLGCNPGEPSGAPAPGVFTDARLSYAGMGLNDGEFQAVSPVRIQSKLEAALNQSNLVAIYGQVFDDGGPNGKGIHETHFNPGLANQDGAVAVYGKDDQGNPQRTWFFFMFSDEHIAAAPAPAAAVA